MNVTRQTVDDRVPWSQWRRDSNPILQSQVQGLEAKLAERTEEVDNLKMSLSETQAVLDSTRNNMAMLLESSARDIEHQKLEHAKQVVAKEEEIKELRTRHQQSVQELVRGARKTLDDLESQLGDAKSSEAEALRQLASVRDENEAYIMRLDEWEEVSKKMEREMEQVKDQLKISEIDNRKVNEEKELWKKYAEKVEDERKCNNRELTLEKKVLNKFGQIESFIKTEKQHRNILLSYLDRFGNNLITELKNLQTLEKTKVEIVRGKTVGTQTDPIEDLESKKQMEILERKCVCLKDELTNKVNDLENILAQNTALRGVVLKIKGDRNVWEREKEQVEEMARVSKLEDSVKRLKSNYVKYQNDVCILSDLQGVKKAAYMSNKKVVNNTTIITPRNIKPIAFGRKF